MIVLKKRSSPSFDPITGETTFTEIPESLRGLVVPVKVALKIIRLDQLSLIESAESMVVVSPKTTVVDANVVVDIGGVTYNYVYHQDYVGTVIIFVRR